MVVILSLARGWRVETIDGEHIKWDRYNNHSLYLTIIKNARQISLNHMNTLALVKHADVQSLELPAFILHTAPPTEWVKTHTAPPIEWVKTDHYTIIWSAAVLYSVLNFWRLASSLTCLSHLCYADIDERVYVWCRSDFGKTLNFRRWISTISALVTRRRSSISSHLLVLCLGWNVRLIA